MTVPDPAAELAQLRESVRLCEEILDAQERAGADIHDGLMVAGQLDVFRRRLRAAESSELSTARESNRQAFADFIEGQMAKPSVLDDLF